MGLATAIEEANRMAVQSTMLPLGTEAPPFALPDVRTGETVSIDDLADRRALVVMFICNHCPYVKRIYDGLAAFGRDYDDAEVGIVAICSNDVDSHPDDAPEALAATADEVGITFPYLFDETQETAQAYGAVCTPDIFVFGPDRRLVYRGQFDDARPGNDAPVTGTSLRAAVDAVLSGEPVPEDQIPSIGCSIKWKPGNEPATIG
jgi:peroxiredoxin